MAGLIEKDGKQSTMTVDSDVFFREILARVNSGKRVKIRAKGSSMLPLVRSTRDVIFLSALTPDSIQEGRLLLVRIPRTPDQVLAEATAVQRGKRLIELGSRLWWRYEHLWPKNDLIRRICLALYRRTFLRWGL